MVERCMKVIVVIVAVLAVAVVAVLLHRSCDDEFESKCIYAVWESNVGTNGQGGVVQPAMACRPGAYTDYRRVAEEGLKCMIPKAGNIQMLTSEYIASCRAKPEPDVMLAVSNAFCSVRYSISGYPVAVVSMSVRSCRRDVALGVAGFLLRRCCDGVEEGEALREEKAVAMMRAEIDRRRAVGEDVSVLYERLDAARKAVRQHGATRITVVQMPFLTR